MPRQRVDDGVRGASWPSDATARQRWYERELPRHVPTKPYVGLVEEWRADDPRLTVGMRKVRDAIMTSGRLCGVLHTVALGPDGRVIETVSVQAPGLVAFFDRHERVHRPSLRRTGDGRPVPFRPGSTVTWTGVGIIRAGRKLTVTALCELLRQHPITEDRS